MKRQKIIELKIKGYSNRQIQKEENINRKTVSRYWQEYIKALEILEENNDDREAKEILANGKGYDVSKRKTKMEKIRLEEYIEDILRSEQEKSLELGERHKQKLTAVQILEMCINEGFNYKYTTIREVVKLKKIKVKEVFIQQSYRLGERAEFDFGEVKLLIQGEYKVFYIAVISCPASNFRWACLYENQNMDVFKDAHVKFFEKVKGVYGEMVYDNMRNVVSRFLGKNEKELNQQLIQLASYYGFAINVTNAFSGNEKGHVEGSVKFIRNKAFALMYKFDSLQEANIYLHNKLEELNQSSKIDEEIKCLNKYRPPFEIGKYLNCSVNKYSFIRIDNKNYSVDEKFVGRKLMVKQYVDVIQVFDNDNKIVHQLTPITDERDTQVDINHYLKTLERKPGSIKRSTALRSVQELETIYIKYYIEKPKLFVKLLKKYKDSPLNDLINGLLENRYYENIVEKQDDPIEDAIEQQYDEINSLTIGRDENDNSRLCNSFKAAQN